MSGGAPRLGLLGGTFDPIHRGHVVAALAAGDALGLDRIVLVPSHVPPHRPVQPRASAYHRFAMAALAAQEHDVLSVDDLELRATGPSYTADTLAAFHARGWRPEQLFFVIGADAFAEIASWRHYPAILDAAHFVVVSRPGHAHETVTSRAPAVTPRLVDLRRTGPAPRDVPASPSVIFLSADTPAASSTEVRRLLATGAAVDHLVPAAVCRHIARHHLYQPPHGGSPVA